MTNEQEREAFEAWHRQDLLDMPVHQDPKERQFRTWQARAAVSEANSLVAKAKPEAQQAAAEVLRTTFEQAFMAHYTNGAHLLERFDTGHYRSDEARAAWRIAVEFRSRLARAEAQAKPEAQQPLTDEQIEGGRSKLFSVGNPYCPITEKAMRTAVRWAERCHGIGASWEASK